MPAFGFPPLLWHHRPEANLFDKQGRQIATHFSGPTRKLDDGSAVVGDIMAKVDAPKPEAIQWLLLRPKSSERRLLFRSPLTSPDGNQGRSSGKNRLQRKPSLGAGAHALLGDLISSLARQKVSSVLRNGSRLRKNGRRREG